MVLRKTVILREETGNMRRIFLSEYQYHKKILVNSRTQQRHGWRVPRWHLLLAFQDEVVWLKVMIPILQVNWTAIAWFRFQTSLMRTDHVSNLVVPDRIRKSTSSRETVVSCVGGIRSLCTKNPGWRPKYPFEKKHLINGFKFLQNRIYTDFAGKPCVVKQCSPCRINQNLNKNNKTRHMCHFIAVWLVMPSQGIPPIRYSLCIPCFEQTLPRNGNQNWRTSMQDYWWSELILN